jgi:hypothetical protein
VVAVVVTVQIHLKFLVEELVAFCKGLLLQLPLALRTQLLLAVEALVEALEQVALILQLLVLLLLVVVTVVVAVCNQVALAVQVVVKVALAVAVHQLMLLVHQAKVMLVALELPHKTVRVAVVGKVL